MLGWGAKYSHTEARCLIPPHTAACNWLPFGVISPQEPIKQHIHTLAAEIDVAFADKWKEQGNSWLITANKWAQIARQLCPLPRRRTPAGIWRGETARARGRQGVAADYGDAVLRRQIWQLIGMPDQGS